MNPWQREESAPLWPARPGVRGLLVGLLLIVAADAIAQPVDFVLTDMEGQVHRLSDHRGKWVVVNYWATWCPPCRDEMPELEQFHRSNPDTAVVIGVNMEDADDTLVRDFIADFDLTFPILRTSARPNHSALVGPVEGLPTTYLVAPSGEPVARQVGKVTADGLHKFIERFNARHAKAAP
jgi:thiol-disulfide isomerase/thioredoxin